MTPPLTSSRQEPSQSSAAGRWSSARWRWLLAALGLALAWHAWRGVAWSNVWPLLNRLGLSALAILLGLNLLMLPLMTARSWLLLRTLGAPVRMGVACAYRLAANAVSYLTPGPHFGGEPLAVLLLRRRHGIPAVRAATSVALDRLLELLASVVVLMLCLLHLAVVRSDPLSGRTSLPLVIGASLPIVLILAALFTGRRPLSRSVMLFKTLGDGWGHHCHFFQPLAKTIAQAEAMAESLFRGRRGQFLLANFFSLFHWIGVFCEYWLMSALLGRPLTFWQLTTVVVVARLAFFTPLPAGIGVLESALPWATAAIGQGSALGVGLCIIIRLRDLLFSLAGLGLTLRYLTSRPQAVIINNTQG
ncbi:MAG: lysylphosphatidylglycerol synthase transmembrane domain-containing protein [Desulfobacteraceae bacterium]|nr:lysylphosphatidylglycerol synthase transmembrane domain-containing protein [Desulfobacteraceae bacterium]